jgi:hypothetical protein
MINKIIKQISLEKSKSRLPGVISAIKDGIFYEFNEDTLLSMYSGNYGLIISDIEIPNKFIDSITDNTDININIPYSYNKDEKDEFIESNGFYLIQGFSRKINENYVNSSDRPKYYYYVKNNTIYEHINTDNIEQNYENDTIKKFLSYRTLIKWYYFFINYMGLLTNTNCHETKEYKNAYDYYVNEVEIHNNEQEKYYLSIDDLYNSRGGKEFYEWICDECIIQKRIPLNIKYGWNTDYLYYPDILKWKSWFKEKYERYSSYTDSDSCINASDCCECTEYFRKGGNEAYKWLNGIKVNIENTDIKSATINIPILITNTIDDMGEFSIFSKEWEGGENYQTMPFVISTGNEIPTNKWISNSEKNGGTIVTYNEQVMKLKNPLINDGFDYDSKYKEFLFPNGENNTSEEWDNYLDYVKSNNPKDYELDYETYTYDRQMKLIPNPEPKDLIEEHDINKENIFVIINNIYKVFESEYIIYKNNIYLVSYYENGTPYTTINNKLYVGLYDNGKYYFNFTRKPCVSSGDVTEIQNTKYFITYNGGNYMVNNNNVTINDTKYSMFNGYTTIDNINYYISGTSLTKLYSSNATIVNGVSTYVMEYEEDTTFGNNLENSMIDNNSKGYIINNDKINIYYPYVIHKSDEVTGYTESKLENVKNYKRAYDDIGNELPGFFALIQTSGGTSYSQPKVGETLDLDYQIGNVNSLSVHDKDNKLFWGDILTEIEFFYYDTNGNILDDTIEKSSDYSNNNLSAITKCKEHFKEMLENGYSIENKMSCRFTYYLGAILKQIEENDGNNYKYDGYELAKDDNDLYINYGVKYIDTVKLIEKTFPYYLSEDENYEINYFEIEYPLNNIFLNEYNDKNLNTKRALFNYKINDLKNDNGFIASPTLMLEYKFGNSSLQNISGDIYVDRGISVAMDKHLKLGEVGSFESLSQYSNGWFNIINNN